MCMIKRKVILSISRINTYFGRMSNSLSHPLFCIWTTEFCKVTFNRINLEADIPEKMSDMAIQKEMRTRLLQFAQLHNCTICTIFYFCALIISLDILVFVRSSLSCIIIIIGAYVLSAYFAPLSARWKIIDNERKKKDRFLVISDARDLNIRFGEYILFLRENRSKRIC